MTPAERLIAAADLLDKRAGEATEGPWRQAGIGDFGWCVIAADHGRNFGIETEDSDQGRADADYIATMHPEVGKQQAALLRLMGSVDYPEVRMGVSVHTQKLFEAMLALADLLLAGES